LTEIGFGFGLSQRAGVGVAGLSENMANYAQLGLELGLSWAINFSEK
jgi:hypothetical protein